MRQRKDLEKDLQKNTYKEQVLISFVGDVYCDNADNSETTREVLKLLNLIKLIRLLPMI